MFTLKVSIISVVPSREVSVAAGTTVGEALNLADVSFEGNVLYKLNGKQVDMSTVITESGLLVGAVQIKGN